MCTAWCTWQALNAKKAKDPAKLQKARVQARLHLDFVCQLYQEQVDAERFFLHEHPAFATSWMEKSIRRINELPSVELVRADQCQYKSEVTFGALKGCPVKKPTGFMSNAPKLLERLRRRCAGGQDGECSRPSRGKHATCSGRIAREAAKYSDELCRQILKGMFDEMKARGIVRDHEHGLHAVTDEPAVEAQVKTMDPRYSGKYKDAMTGQVLRDDLVQEARAKELDYFCVKGVWVKRPKGEARRATGRLPITVRWVDVNKGDDLNPRYR